MPRVVLFHLKPEEAAAPAAVLGAAGFDVATERPTQPSLRALRDEPPDAVLVDLSRSPSSGRDVGLWMRSSKALRRVPLVFVGGDPAKVAAIRTLLPDATFTTWDAVAKDLSRAIAEPLLDPVKPTSSLAGYAGAPLPKKLGIRRGISVYLLDAPGGFEDTLGSLPEGVDVLRAGAPGDGLLLWFVRSRRDLDAGIAAMAGRVGAAGMWIVWPKRTSGVTADLGQQIVRDAGLANGLVDYKVCSIDATWSGLRFARRSTPPAAARQARRSP